MCLFKKNTIVVVIWRPWDGNKQAFRLVHLTSQMEVSRILMDISKCKKGLWMTTDLKRAVSSSVRVLFSHRTFFKGLSKSYAFSLSHFHDDFLRFFFIRNTCGFGLLYVIQKMIYLAVFCRASKSTKGRTNGMQWWSYHQYQVLYILRLSPIAEQREGR